MLAYGVPDRMAAAVHAVFMREGQARHADKIAVIDAVLCDGDRVPLTAPEGAIYRAAHQAARECYAIVATRTPCGHPITAWMHVVMQVQAVCARLGVLYPLGQDEAEQFARAVDAGWWVRAIRKEWSRRFEHTAIRLGLVGKHIDPYLSRESAIRQAARNAQNAKLLEAVKLTNGTDVFSLAELAAKGTGNKAIRRGELMTRIKGFEEIATDMKHVGLFFTLTNPSKYHSVGGTNPKYNGASPRQGQAQLCRVWSRIRAALGRAGIMPYGFRIAEPHMDGCPHWHMLLFVHADLVGAMEKIVRHYALEEDGDEEGAQENRVDVVRMETDGGRSAVGYIIKYVAKNIDGHGVGEHHAEEGGKTYVVTPDIFGDLEITASDRVTYWAQTWGIRQFQQIGGAPVTVWRELRRVKKEAIDGAAPEAAAAWAAVQKTETGEKDEAGKPVMKQASWKEYLLAQGGATPGRGYAVRIATEVVEIDGKYATYTAKKPIGIYAQSMAELIHASTRYKWEVLDLAFDVALPTRTCVNNCTGALGSVIELSLRTGSGGSVSVNMRLGNVNSAWQVPGEVPKALENKIFSRVDLVSDVVAPETWAARHAERAAAYRRGRGDA